MNNLPSYLLDEVLRLSADGSWEDVGHRCDALVGLILRLGFERRLPDEELVAEHSHRPVVHLEMTRIM